MLDPKIAAQKFADEASNDKGDILARLWMSPEFMLEYDPKRGYEKKGMLKLKQESVFRFTEMKTKLFQKLYYNPDLTLEDEVQLREYYISKSAFFDMRTVLFNYAAFFSFFPGLYYITRIEKGWPGVYIAGFLWVGGYMILQSTRKTLFQMSLNRFASPLAEKYNMTDHFSL